MRLQKILIMNENNVVSIYPLVTSVSPGRPDRRRVTLGQLVLSRVVMFSLKLWWPSPRPERGKAGSLPLFWDSK